MSWLQVLRMIDVRPVLYLMDEHGRKAIPEPLGPLSYRHFAGEVHHGRMPPWSLGMELQFSRRPNPEMSSALEQIRDLWLGDPLFQGELGRELHWSLLQQASEIDEWLRKV